MRLDAHLRMEQERKEVQARLAAEQADREARVLAYQ